MDGGNDQKRFRRSSASFDSHERAYFSESLIAHSLDQHQVFDSAEWAVSFAVLDDLSGERFANMRDLQQFLQRGGVYVHGVGERLLN